ncbi:MAG: sulfite exporter TauE/SafE family protein [Thermomicrobiales bacterium]
MFSNTELALAFFVAVAGGMINGIAGGGTVLVFPMLVWLGLGPVEANVTNAVSLWTASLGGALGFGEALRRTRRWWFWMSIPAALGGLAGALLLVLLPAGIFESSAPFFVLSATLLMLSQPVLRRQLEHLTDGDDEDRISTAVKIAATIAVFVISIYGGYFGAGLGIFLLVALGLLGVGNLVRANGLKNVFSFLIKGVAVLSFAITGNVVWKIALVLMVGSVLGAFVAARLGSRISARALRYSIIGVGFIMSALMFAGIAG